LLKALIFQAIMQLAFWGRSMKGTIVLALVLAVCLVSCGDSEDGSIGGGFAQCQGHTPGAEDGSPEVAAAISTFVPSDAEVHCTGKRSFELDGRMVFFIMIPYGELQDCISGCFSSDVCAIVEGLDAFLYSADWNHGSERPLSIPPDCPELVFGVEGGGKVPDCTGHPLTQEAAFENFKQAQGSGGPFRFCF
jgi:hypothetical protein